MLSLEEIQDIVINAKQLRITGTASDLDLNPSIEYLNMSDYAGVIEYHPEELVITVKAGTTIKELNRVLADNHQVTPFNISDTDSGADADNATIGGAYAVGNPDLRDAVLGIKIIDGQGRILTFGGQVMKNVAGYDVARLLVGSKGQHAVICEISFKLIPKTYANDQSKESLLKLKGNDKAYSPLKENFEQGLKSIFDPNGIFI